MNIVEIFEQTEYWVTQDRIKIRLTEMDEHHRAATLAMLRRRADYQMMMYYRIQERYAITCPDDGVWVQFLQERDHAITDGAEAWLERRPFIKELARLVRKDELERNAVDGEVVDVVPDPRGRFAIVHPNTEALRASFERRSIEGGPEASNDHRS